MIGIGRVRREAGIWVGLFRGVMAIKAGGNGKGWLGVVYWAYNGWIKRKSINIPATRLPYVSLSPINKTRGEGPLTTGGVVTVVVCHGLNGRCK